MKEHPIIFSGEMVKAILDGRKTQTRRVIKPQPEYADGYRYWWKGDWDTRGGPRAGVCTHGSSGNGEPTWTLDEIVEHCPCGTVGDRLWVREAWKINTWASRYIDIWYSANKKCERRSTEQAGYFYLHLDAEQEKWETTKNKKHFPYRNRPSIFMPKWAARLWLEITGIRAERVQEITGPDILAEGIDLPIPANCNPSPPPDGWPTWTKKQQDEWAKGHARTVYFARCADVDDHFVEFQGLWNSLNAKRGFGWDKNPYVWVIEFKQIEGAEK